MLRFLDVEQEEETLLAGYKPIPKNRMLRQANREGNDFYTNKGYGPFRRKDNRNARQIRTNQKTLQRLMATDPDLRRMYVEQIQSGNEPQEGDKFNLRRDFIDQDVIILEHRPVDMNVYNSGGPKRTKGGLRFKEERREDPKQTMPDDLKKRTLSKIEEVERFINEDYDPVGAVNKEMENRRRGGNKPIINGPDAAPIDPMSVPELIQPIAPLDQNQYPYERMGMPGV